MPLTSRQTRPLKRDKTYRDDRLFIVACDDTYAPQQYFDAFRMPRVHIHVVPTQDGSSAAPHVLNRLEQYPTEAEDERWMLLDTDHYDQGTHRPSFIQAIQDAKQKGIRVAVSKPCFEFWLCMHHADALCELRGIHSAEDAEHWLRTKLGQYNKTHIEPERYGPDLLAVALKLARELDATVQGGDLPESSTSRVYQLWESILQHTPRAQLPEKLRDWN